MCVAVPGKIIHIHEAEGGAGPGALATVEMQGNRLKASLAMTPEARQGDWVLVHAGFTLTVIDEEEARETWEAIQIALGDPDRAEERP
jgi:hydrogenase expression/formation protein HypC